MDKYTETRAKYFNQCLRDWGREIGTDLSGIDFDKLTMDQSLLIQNGFRLVSQIIKEIIKQQQK
jgi:hypothetical protein